MVVSAASFRYDDGKKLTGIGTRASKSRLTTFQVRENVFSNAFRVVERKTRRGLLLLLRKEGEEETIERFLTRLRLGLGEDLWKCVRSDWGMWMKKFG